MTDNTAERIMLLSDALEEKWFGDFMGLAWLFLNMLQSETIPLEVGTNDQLSTLPTCRHSAVVFKEADVFGVPAMTCAAHRIGARFQKLTHTDSGTKVFFEIHSATYALATVRRYLRLLQVPSSERAIINRSVLGRQQPWH